MISTVEGGGCESFDDRCTSKALMTAGGETW